MRLVNPIVCAVAVATAVVPAAAQDLVPSIVPEPLLAQLDPPVRTAILDAQRDAAGAVLVVECNGFFGYGFETIQAAIDAAGVGDVVLVLPRNHDGIECDSDAYFENIDFLGKPITVTSATGPEHTIIDAEGDGRPVTFATNEGPASVLHGFTLTNGNVLPGGAGGGIRCDDSDPIISNCIVRDCVAEVGGGIYVNRGDVLIRNCLVANNQAYGYVGIACVGDVSDVAITGCTIVGNFTMDGGTNRGGGVAAQRADVDLINSIVWGNTADAGPQLLARIGGRLEVAYSAVQGAEKDVFIDSNGLLIWSDGNIDADPLFVDAAGGDYHLTAISPARNAGDPDAIPEPDETDIDGEPRIIQVRIDMGADEFAGCFTDIDTSGAVDFADLVQLLSVWGPCAGCVEDVDGNGAVDLGDLLLLLGTWGPCA